MITFKLQADQSERLSRFMANETGSELIDIITDNIVLNDSSTPEAKAGAGDVLKFLRSLAKSENLHVTKRKESNE